MLSMLDSMYAGVCEPIMSLCPTGHDSRLKLAI